MPENLRALLVGSPAGVPLGRRCCSHMGVGMEDLVGTQVRMIRPRTPSDPPLAALRKRTVVVIDDHCSFADLLGFAIDAEPDLTCVGKAYDLVSGLSLVVERQPDIVVMDLQFEGDEGDGLTATRALTRRFPHIHVVLLTGHAEFGLLARAAEARVSSVLPKNGLLPDLLDALRVAGRGGLLVHPHLLELSAAQTEARAPKGLLSPREQDVLAMLMLGLTTAAIAAELGISTNTCRGYIKSLLWKLGAHSRLEAVAIARRRGLVPPDGDR